MKENIDKEKRDTLKRSLSSLVDDSFPEETGNLLAKPKSEEELKPYNSFNHDEREHKVRNRAIKTINSLLRLYLDDKTITNNDYIKAKANMDKSNMYQLMLAIEQMEHAIKVLLADIDTGNSSPRMFEVYGNLQRTRMELLRECNNLMADVEESTKKVKNDIEILDRIKEDTKPQNILISGNGFTSRGNKDLMRSLREKREIELKEKNVENGKEESQSFDGEFE